MNSHSTQESPAPARPWLPLLLILATLLTAGLMCGDALTRSAPAPDLAETDTQPGIALDGDSGPRPDDAAHDPLVVDSPADSTVLADPPSDAAVESVVELTAIDSAPATTHSNGNTNAHANPNGYTNNAQTGNGQSGNGRPGNGKP